MLDPRSSIGVLIAEGHRRASERMLELCTCAPDLELLGLVTSAAEMTDHILLLQPTVAVLDASLWSGDLIAAMHDLASRAPTTRLVVVVPTAASIMACQLIRAGVTSVVLQSMTGDTLLQIIRAAAQGDGFIPREILPVAAVPEPIALPATLAPDLTRREREIASLVAQHQSNQAIADTLHISIATVKTYKRRIKVKSIPPSSRR